MQEIDAPALAPATRMAARTQKTARRDMVSAVCVLREEEEEGRRWEKGEGENFWSDQRGGRKTWGRRESAPIRLQRGTRGHLGRHARGRSAAGAEPKRESGKGKEGARGGFRKKKLPQRLYR